jgi:hypothetical protein
MWKKEVYQNRREHPHNAATNKGWGSKIKEPMYPDPVTKNQTEKEKESSS